MWKILVTSWCNNYWNINKIKENAKKLEELSFLRGLHFGKEASDLSSMQEIIPLKEGEVTTQDLWNALKKLARKNIAKMPLKANIQHETHTVEELMDSIISKIEHTDKKQVPFEECFPAFNRHAITTTFLAMLQLVRGTSCPFYSKFSIRGYFD